MSLMKTYYDELVKVVRQYGDFNIEAVYSKTLKKSDTVVGTGLLANFN